ncbi:MAG: HAMP domain-containing histidine kinase [Proteobacteria bacterium]|nr:MAG: HAMP domain-containing histidine kinase [Pseudomonadota bacterium]
MTVLMRNQSARSEDLDIRSMNFGKFRSSLTFRIVLYICALQIFSFVAMFALSLVIGTNFIEGKDRQLLDAKLTEYESVLKAEGLKAIEARIEDQKSTKVDHEFYVRVLKLDGSLDLKQLPYDLDDFDESKVLTELSVFRGPKKSFELHSPTSWDDRFLGFSKQIDSNTILQVGKSVEDWEDFTNHLYKGFLKALLPFTLIGLLGGYLIAKRSLRPVRSMIRTMQLVGNGTTSERMNINKTDYEFASMVDVFNQMLERIELLITTMRDSLDSVSHDIRTPLTRIRTRAELALRGPTSEEDYRSALEECIENAAELSIFATTVMDISEAEAGTMKLDLVDIDSHQLLSEVVDLYDIVAQDAQILLEIEQDSEGVTFRGDRARIKQAVANLVDNAIKYSMRDSDVYLKAERVGGSVRISVRDEGMGIGPADIHRIWEKLFRADKSRSLPGLGLGLSTVASIAVAHGGSVKVESRVGEGSTFFFEVPS